MYKRNLTLLGIAVVSFAFFIISIYAFGFRAQDPGSMSGFQEIWGIKNGAGNVWSEKFAKNAYGLLISGLVFSAVSIIFAFVCDWLAIEHADWGNKHSTVMAMEIVTIFLIALSSILMLSGELVYLTKLAKHFDKSFSDYWKTGYVAGMLIFTLLPLPILATPYLIKTAD
ncbi:hypothetical protein JN01_0187 [Entomoplasma freundtii]|uniref:Uncharacterized protein n=1 Tax=Entomoplasma freundtii TaxID=74700 RepID=A0A2K8NRX1_9MOLU|nr:hypothetical protein [Entomoplasma freundtii]ATZ16602.1 hypothetical protein EFREU_v1c05810 [Entomoplasma freundtii]TDY58232.1 hypothetical protein JN01_0187 [Entomoplasma freundtii]